MKVETPQILWNSEGDKGLNAALYSISMLESGVGDFDGGFQRFGNVLATSGNTNIINLWKVCFRRADTFHEVNNNNHSNGNNNSMYQMSAAQHPQTKKHKKRHNPNQNNKINIGSNSSNASNNNKIQNLNDDFRKIEFLCSLTRHEQAVNTVSFSPDGLHLATAGDTGSIIVWSVPLSKRGNGNGKHYWSTITRESDLVVKVVPTASGSGGITDISWSSDSKRFLCGTIDHTVFVVEDTNYNNTTAAAADSTITSSPATGGEQQQPVQQLDSNWKIIFRNGMDHTQYVQGVTYDPLGVYLASMSSDRSVRVFARKTPPKSKKKVLRPFSTITTNTPSSDTSALSHPNSPSVASQNNNSNSTYSNPIPPVEHQSMVDQLLTDSKFELHKSKQIKFRRITTTTTTTTTMNNEDEDSGNNNGAETTSTFKRHLYADESTLESFFRRLSWTTDGAFLVTPAALWHPQQVSSSSSSAPSFATYLFARHKFDEPYKVLSGLEKPSVVVRPSPILYKVPKAAVVEDSKENQNPTNSGVTLSTSGCAGNLPYRSIFAVLTLDSVLIYDTYHTRPLCIIRGLHYANLVDCTWSADGTNLVICSTDGYVSFIAFEPEELGQVYHPQPQATPQRQSIPTVTPKSSERNSIIGESDINPSNNVADQQPLIPPCEPGQSATLEAPPSKRIKKTRITPTLISTSLTTLSSSSISQENKHKRSGDDDENTCPVTSTSEAVKQKLTLQNTESENQEPIKKKKRIQPTLVCTSVTS